MIEDELRATFARHEQLAPPVGPVRGAIDRIAARRRRRRRRLAVSTASAALVVLAMVSVPVLVRTISPTPAQVDLGTASSGSSLAPDTALNFLLLGLDGRAGSDQGYRADSVLILHVPRDRGAAYLVSLPRDARVEIPGHRAGKLNESFELGSSREGVQPDLASGVRLTGQTIKKLTGLAFDGAAALTFTGLRDLTDALGGVRLCLPQAVRSFHTKRVFPSGCQQLDGAAALDLLRQRYALPGGAHDRDRNAQRFAAALVDKVTSTQSITNPVGLSKVLQAVGDQLVIDTGGAALADLLPILTEIAGKRPVGIGWEFDDSSTDGTMDPTVTAPLFAALRGDTMAGWVAAHPERVTP